MGLLLLLFGLYLGDLLFLLGRVIAPQASLLCQEVLLELFSPLGSVFSMHGGFLDAQAAENLGRRRLFMFVAIAVWAGFGYWDYYHYIRHGQALSRMDFYWILIWWLAGTLAGVAAAWVSFTARFDNERWVNRTVVIAVCFAQTCLVAMTQIVPARTFASTARNRKRTMP